MHLPMSLHDRMPIEEELLCRHFELHSPAPCKIKQKKPLHILSIDVNMSGVSFVDYFAVVTYRWGGITIIVISNNFTFLSLDHPPLLINGIMFSDHTRKGLYAPLLLSNRMFRCGQLCKRPPQLHWDFD